MVTGHSVVISYEPTGTIQKVTAADDERKQHNVNRRCLENQSAVGDPGHSSIRVDILSLCSQPTSVRYGCPIVVSRE